MSPRRAPPFLVAIALLACGAAHAKGKDKEPAKPPAEVKKGKFDLKEGRQVIRMGVPEDYDPKTHYPMFFVLHATNGKAADWTDPWSDVLNKQGWIVAGPQVDGDYQNEGHVEPLKSALRAVRLTYSIDERRVVIAGHIAGGVMAWRMAIVAPDLFAGVVSMSGGPASGDKGMLKRLAGKPAYLFAGGKDTYYPPEKLEKDKIDLDFAKVKATTEVRPDWGLDFSKSSVPKVAEWLKEVWPPGAYREKAAALEAAVEAKDFAAGQAAMKELLAELKKNPYPAYEARAKALGEELLAAGRALVADAKAKVAEGRPLDALERAEAAAKALKGLKPVDAEASSALAALRKDPAVVAALAQKKAEDAVSSYMEKAAAAESKGDAAKALEWYRKAVALGETSRTAEAQAKVAELEAKAGGTETR